MATKFGIEKFSGENDFKWWRNKIKAILIKQGYTDGIKGEANMSASLYQKKKIDKTKSPIIPSWDKELMEVTKTELQHQ